jgi:hypothetical protein
MRPPKREAENRCLPPASLGAVVLIQEWPNREHRFTDVGHTFGASLPKCWAALCLELAKADVHLMAAPASS